MKSLSGIRVKAKKSDQVCPIHHIKMVLGHDGKPFCVECYREKIKQEKINQVKKFKQNEVTSVLTKKSLVDDISDFDKSFSNFKAAKGSREAKLGNACYKIAREFTELRDKPLTVLLYGTPGEGKTHLALSMLKEINNHSKPPQSCLFIDISTLFELIYKSKEDTTCWWTRYNAIKFLTSVGVLCLDDLGSESSMRSEATEATDFRQGILKEILDKQKRLIITTNLTMQQLKEVYNPKIVSRLLANSNGQRLDFTGIKDKRYIL